ncbi:MAG: hypothetical protein IJI73_02170 [Kiritimatiellae bacterium]|nr:hypothetical protein [Kiritimatiellia bacterium]
MKATIAILAVAASFAAAAEEASEPATASPGKFSAEVSVDVLSDYIWRGKICNGNPVWQPGVTLAYDAGDLGKVSANVWASLDLTHRRGTANASRRGCGIQELDYTLAYANSIGPVGVEVGHIWYNFPYGNGRPTEEIYATVSYENPVVTPSLTAYWDYLDTAGNDVSAVYATFALSRDFALNDELKLTPKAEISFADHAYTGSAGGTELTEQTLGLAATYAVTKNLSVGAQINYTWTPSHTLRKEGYMGEGEHQIVWGGVNATLTF